MFQRGVRSSIFLWADRDGSMCALELPQQGTALICTRRQDHSLLERS